MPTVREVAALAGVSTATVSRVLSSSPKVSPAARTAVLSAVQDLNYHPNSAAKSLRTARTGKLIVTLPDISNPFFSLIIQGIEEAAQQHGYAVLLGATQDDQVKDERFGLMLGRREADGLIFLGHRMPDALAELVARDAHAPVVNGCDFSPSLKVPSVHIDNRLAGADAIAHLASLGHRRIGVITGPMSSPLSADRLAGAHTATGGVIDLQVAHGDFSVESGALGMQALLERRDRPTAVFCFSDEMAIGALSAARAAGLRAPQDISLVGFDDIKFAEHMDPPLTTIRQPMLEIGRQTVRLLVELLDSAAPPPKSVTLPHELIVRKSTAPPQ